MQSDRNLLNKSDISSFNDIQLADYLGQEIGYLFQEFELFDNLTTKENIALPLVLHGVTGDQAEQEIQELATRLGINDVLNKFSSQIFGGQKQRVAAARALINARKRSE